MTRKSLNNKDSNKKKQALEQTHVITWILYKLESTKDFFRDPIDWLDNRKIKVIDQYIEEKIKKRKEKRSKIIKQAKSPLVSIILPVLNSEKTIYKAIHSIQKQSYKNWELIIINDGSTDKTNNLIKEIAKQDQRIIIYKNLITKGVAYSRNIGLHHAKGEYITFHDADDRSNTERLEYQLAQLCSKAELKVVTFLYCRETKNGRALITNGKIKWNRVSGMMFKREVFNKIGYFKPLHISEDSEYYERIRAVYGKKSCKKIKKLLYYSLFDTHSLLFSNADIKIKNDRIYYKINSKEYEILRECRNHHNAIKQKKTGIKYYQTFRPYY